MYHSVLPRLSPSNVSELDAHALGVHLEGPYISYEKRGAHNPSLVQSVVPSFAEFEKMYGSLSDVRVVTIAPELPGALEVIPSLVSRGIAVSIGHSSANIATAMASVTAGANLITVAYFWFPLMSQHLFNAMQPFHHRDPGIVGLLGSVDPPAPFFSIIADGHHCHPASLRIAARSHPRGTVLVTDAIVALGFTDGLYKLESVNMEVKDGVAYVQGTSTLAGSIAGMDACIRNYIKFGGGSVVEGIAAATIHPADAIGAKSKGRLEPGCDGDVVLLNKNLEVQSTYVMGKVAFDRLSL